MTERIILKGRAETLKPIITQIMAIHQLIENRDIGEYCGYPIDEMVRGKPQTFKIKLLYYSVKFPPWRETTTKGFIRASYNIPFVDKTKIDWERIKEAAGGANGYMWGRWRATANIEDNGQISQMQIHGSTENEAEQRLRALLALSEGKIVSLSTTEEKKEGQRTTDKKLYKETTRVYPAFFTIVHSEKIITESKQATATLSGNYRKTKFRIPLWTTTKPSNADALIREAIRVRGTTTT